MKHKDLYELLIPGLCLWLHVGCDAEERSAPQPIDIDIRIEFPLEPRGCKSDRLSDVLCYHTLAEHITQSIQNRSFHLLEYLAANIFEAIQDYVPEGVVEIAVTKLHHPVPHVSQGITFKYKKSLCKLP